MFYRYIQQTSLLLPRKRCWFRISKCPRILRQISTLKLCVLWPRHVIMCIPNTLSRSFPERHSQASSAIVCVHICLPTSQIRSMTQRDKPLFFEQFDWIYLIVSLLTIKAHKRVVNLDVGAARVLLSAPWPIYRAQLEVFNTGRIKIRLKPCMLCNLSSQARCSRHNQCR